MHQSLQRFLNKEHSSAITLRKNTKEEFLSEHNRLSSPSMQTNMSLLSRFRIEKASIFKSDNWPIDKLRRPFILWLTSLTIKEKENIRKLS